MAGKKSMNLVPKTAEVAVTPPKAVRSRLEAVQLVPGWDEIGWLRSGFSTRLGGVSTVYAGCGTKGELNIGWTPQDDPALVAENRRRLMRAVGASKMEMVALRQVHSGVIRVVEKEHGPLKTSEGKAVIRGDGAMTDVPGLLLAVQVADCVPVLIVDKKHKAVAVFHAGWRGTVKRIVEHGVGTMRLRYGSKPENLIAAIGPSIGACCYAVGEEVRQEFTSQFTYAEELFNQVDDPVRGPQMHVDLWEANRRQLLDAGLKPKKITVLKECSSCATVNGGRKYFSHRAERGFAGRMMGIAGIAL